MDLLIKNIKWLIQTEETPRKWVAGNDMDKLEVIENAYLLISDEIISDYGLMENCPTPDAVIEIDANNRVVMPTFCDSHTHLVYAGSREIEYVDKIRGLTYEEIAKRGGGILNSAKLMRQISENDLYEQSLERIMEIISSGTGAVEIKSGYGLDTKSEIKMLKVIKRLSQTTPITIKSTFLGAHAVPEEFKENQKGYVDKIINEMIPEIASEELAEYIDVFCDNGFFTVEDTERILMAGIKYGLRPKIHANELALSGGVQVGVKYNALSVDHLEFIEQNEINSLINSETMPTILPGAAFFLNMKESPVRTMINNGLPIALASDFNPGSSPSGNMKFVMSLGCINYKMTPNEVINATTLNTAYAMGLENELGSIAKGKKANIIISKPVPSIEYLPYAYTSNLVEKVILNGAIMEFE